MGRAEHIILQITKLEQRLESLVLSHDDRVIIQRAIDELTGELASYRALVEANYMPMNEYVR